MTTREITICIDKSIDCSKFHVDWLGTEGLIIPCLDDNCITIALDPTKPTTCIEGFIICLDKNGVQSCKNCKPVYFKKCFCDEDNDCAACATCDTLTNTCKDTCTAEELAQGFLCYGDKCKCPVNKPVFDPKTKKCAECISGTTDPLNSCRVCVDGEWVSKPCGDGICDQTTGDCIPDCSKNNDGRTRWNPITKICDCKIGFRWSTVKNICVPDVDCLEGFELNPVTDECEEIFCPDGYIYDKVLKDCVPKPCSGTCTNGLGCSGLGVGKLGCGCDLVTKKCVDCVTNPTAAGCLPDDCGRSNCTTPADCNGSLNCGCFTGICVDCSNFGAEDCEKAAGCKFLNGKCTKNPETDGKKCSNDDFKSTIADCALTTVFKPTDNCSCSQITGRITNDNAIINNKSIGNEILLTTAYSFFYELRKGSASTKAGFESLNRLDNITKSNISHNELPSEGSFTLKMSPKLITNNSISYPNAIESTILVQNKTALNFKFEPYDAYKITNNITSYVESWEVELTYIGLVFPNKCDYKSGTIFKKTFITGLSNTVRNDNTFGGTSDLELSVKALVSQSDKDVLFKYQVGDIVDGSAVFGNAFYMRKIYIPKINGVFTDKVFGPACYDPISKVNLVSPEGRIWSGFPYKITNDCATCIEATEIIIPKLIVCESARPDVVPSKCNKRIAIAAYEIKCPINKNIDLYNQNGNCFIPQKAQVKFIHKITFQDGIIIEIPYIDSQESIVYDTITTEGLLGQSFTIGTSITAFEIYHSHAPENVNCKLADKKFIKTAPPFNYTKTCDNVGVKITVNALQGNGTFSDVIKSIKNLDTNQTYNEIQGVFDFTITKLSTDTSITTKLLISYLNSGCDIEETITANCCNDGTITATLSGAPCNNGQGKLIINYSKWGGVPEVTVNGALATLLPNATFEYIVTEVGLYVVTGKFGNCEKSTEVIDVSCVNITATLSPSIICDGSSSSILFAGDAQTKVVYTTPNLISNTITLNQNGSFTASPISDIGNYTIITVDDKPLVPPIILTLNNIPKPVVNSIISNLPTVCISSPVIWTINATPGSTITYKDRSDSPVTTKTINNSGVLTVTSNYINPGLKIFTVESITIGDNNICNGISKTSTVMITNGLTFDEPVTLCNSDNTKYQLTTKISNPTAKIRLSGSGNVPGITSYTKDIGGNIIVVGITAGQTITLEAVNANENFDSAQCKAELSKTINCICENATFIDNHLNAKICLGSKIPSQPFVITQTSNGSPAVLTATATYTTENNPIPVLIPIAKTIVGQKAVFTITELPSNSVQNSYFSIIIKDSTNTNCDVPYQYDIVVLPIPNVNIVTTVDSLCTTNSNPVTFNAVGAPIGSTYVWTMVNADVTPNVVIPIPIQTSSIFNFTNTNSSLFNNINSIKIKLVVTSNGCVINKEHDVSIDRPNIVFLQKNCRNDGSGAYDLDVKVSPAGALLSVGSITVNVTNNLGDRTVMGLLPDIIYNYEVTSGNCTFTDTYRDNCNCINNILLTINNNASVCSDNDTINGSLTVSMFPEPPSGSVFKLKQKTTFADNNVSNISDLIDGVHYYITGDVITITSLFNNANGSSNALEQIQVLVETPVGSVICNSDVELITLTVNGLTGEINGQNEICLDNTNIDYSFSNYSPTYDYKWYSFVNGSYSLISTAYPLSSNFQTSTILKLEVIANGCTTSFIKPITVHNPGNPNITTNTNIVCAGNVIEFIVGNMSFNTNIVTYEIVKNAIAGSTTTLSNNGVILINTTAGLSETYSINLHSKSSNLNAPNTCVKNITSSSVTTNVAPTIQIQQSGTTCTNNVISYSITTSGNNSLIPTDYNWIIKKGQQTYTGTGMNTPNMSFIPNEFGTYTIKLELQLGGCLITTNKQTIIDTGDASQIILGVVTNCTDNSITYNVSNASHYDDSIGFINKRVVTNNTITIANTPGGLFRLYNNNGNGCEGYREFPSPGNCQCNAPTISGVNSGVINANTSNFTTNLHFNVGSGNLNYSIFRGNTAVGTSLSSGNITANTIDRKIIITSLSETILTDNVLTIKVTRAENAGCFTTLTITPTIVPPHVIMLKSTSCSNDKTQRIFKFTTITSATNLTTNTPIAIVNSVENNIPISTISVAVPSTKFISVAYTVSGYTAPPQNNIPVSDCPCPNLFPIIEEILNGNSICENDIVFKIPIQIELPKNNLQVLLFDSNRSINDRQVYDSGLIYGSSLIIYNLTKPVSINSNITMSIIDNSNPLSPCSLTLISVSINVISRPVITASTICSQNLTQRIITFNNVTSVVGLRSGQAPTPLTINPSNKSVTVTVNQPNSYTSVDATYTDVTTGCPITTNFLIENCECESVILNSNSVTVCRGNKFLNQDLNITISNSNYRLELINKPSINSPLNTEKSLFISQPGITSFVFKDFSNVLTGVNDHINRYLFVKLYNISDPSKCVKTFPIDLTTLVYNHLTTEHRPCGSGDDVGYGVVASDEYLYTFDQPTTIVYPDNITEDFVTFIKVKPSVYSSFTLIMTAGPCTSFIVVNVPSCACTISTSNLINGRICNGNTNFSTSPSLTLSEANLVVTASYTINGVTTPLLGGVIPSTNYTLPSLPSPANGSLPLDIDLVITKPNTNCNLKVVLKPIIEIPTLISIAGTDCELGDRHIVFDSEVTSVTGSTTGLLPLLFFNDQVIVPIENASITVVRTSPAGCTTTNIFYKDYDYSDCTCNQAKPIVQNPFSNNNEPCPNTTVTGYKIVNLPSGYQFSYFVRLIRLTPIFGTLTDDPEVQSDYITFLTNNSISYTINPGTGNINMPIIIPHNFYQSDNIIFNIGPFGGYYQVTVRMNPPGIPACDNLVLDISPIYCCPNLPMTLVPIFSLLNPNNPSGPLKLNLNVNNFETACSGGGNYQWSNGGVGPVSNNITNTGLIVVQAICDGCPYSAQINITSLCPIKDYRVIGCNLPLPLQYNDLEERRSRGANGTSGCILSIIDVVSLLSPTCIVGAPTITWKAVNNGNGATITVVAATIAPHSGSNNYSATIVCNGCTYTTDTVTIVMF